MGSFLKNMLSDIDHIIQIHAAKTLYDWYELQTFVYLWVFNRKINWIIIIRSSYTDISKYTICKSEGTIQSANLIRSPKPALNLNQKHQKSLRNESIKFHSEKPKVNQERITFNRIPRGRRRGCP